MASYHSADEENTGDLSSLPDSHYAGPAVIPALPRPRGSTRGRAPGASLGLREIVGAEGGGLEPAPTAHSGFRADASVPRGTRSRSEILALGGVARERDRGRRRG